MNEKNDMSDRLTNLLSERDWLLADGATGSNLFDRGLQSGDAPELWNVEHPERIADLHRAFVEAGADIILTNTFGGTRHRLKLHKSENRVAELNEAAARLARGEADRVERTVLVAGSMGPTGEILEPLGPLTLEGAREAFAEQAAALKNGGADLLWIENHVLRRGNRSGGGGRAHHRSAGGGHIELRYEWTNDDGRYAVGTCRVASQKSSCCVRQ